MVLTIVRSLITGIISFGFSFAKLLPIIGSSFGFFSTHAVFLPAAGLLGGPISVGMYLLLKLLLSKITVYKALQYQLLNNCGGIAASISWSNKKGLNLGIIFLCTALFLMHPVGSQTPFYTFYWIIPFLLIITNQSSFFCRSFTATWIAHAVGSIVWLYAHNVSISEWTFLTMNPMVIGERILFALGIMASVWLMKLTEQCFFFFYTHYLLRLKTKVHA